MPDPVRAAVAQHGGWWGALRAGSLTVREDTRHGDELDRLLAAAGVAAWWAVPCRGLEDVEAALVVLRDRVGPISPLQREQLDQLVTTAGLAFERASLHSRLAHAAFHDPLTGLGNRGLFFQRDDDRLQSGAALLYVDLDRFKPVNDRLGHTAGDLVLVTVADRIRRAVRPDDRLTRFGGDEFVVECTGVRSDQEAIVIAERIIAAVQEPIRLDVGEIRVGVSVGIARAVEPVGVDDLLDRSDAALLAAKAAGKGRWHLAAP
jgi:diguanylate cyclase (GGDEF)-like protein